MVTELNKTVPANQRGALDEATTNLPANLRLRTCLHFPLQDVKFLATVNYGGSPWHDFGWITVADDQEGAEPDPVEPATMRMLVKFWAFTKWKGRLYAFVTYFTKVTGTVSHPILAKYKHQHVTRYNRATKSMQLVQPFYAISVDSIIATAAVFPDPDYIGHPDAPDFQVLLHESWVYLCGGKAGMLPSVELLHVVPESVALPSMPNQFPKGCGNKSTGDEEEDDEEEEDALIEDGDEVEYDDETA